MSGRSVKNFNIIIAGVGGQGPVTLLKILADAAFGEGHDVKSSELHGLSQRGGSVEAHLRFGEKIYSPLVPYAKADLVLGLDMMEALRKTQYAGKNTNFLVNKVYMPFEGGLSEQVITDKLNLLGNKAYLEQASELCRKSLGTDVVAGIYLLGYGVSKGLIPLEKKSLLESFGNNIPKEFLEINKKAFELA